jgi:hypothetical protein
MEPLKLPNELLIASTIKQELAAFLSKRLCFRAVIMCSVVTYTFFGTRLIILYVHLLIQFCKSDMQVICKVVYFRVDTTNVL